MEDSMDIEDNVYYDSQEDDQSAYEAFSPAVKDEPEYEILSEEDIRQRQDEVLSYVTTFLSLSRSEAVVLLEHFDWSVSKVTDEWFGDEERVRKIVGLVRSDPQQEEDRNSLPAMTCQICFESHIMEQMKSAGPCGHLFCNACWTAYIHIAIENGPGCLTLHCAHPSCTAAIREDMVLSLVSQTDGAKYARYRLRAYVEKRITSKWCPAKGCEYVVEKHYSSSSFSVLCKCSHKFCWNCLEEDHLPAACETVAKWAMRCSSGSDNMTWIRLNSKPCPKCKRPIEKNEGCIHMTCQPPCRFQFCWLCLGAWTDHNARTGGILGCNVYDEAVNQGRYEEEQKRRKRARNELDNYTYVYERWVTYVSLSRKAVEDLQQMRDVKMDHLHNKHCLTMAELEFLPNAWLQIVECLRIMKWTDVYRCYTRKDDPMFTYLRLEAKDSLNRLFMCAKKEVKQFLDGKDTQINFNEYRIKLLNLTTLAHDYFQRFIQHACGDWSGSGTKRQKCLNEGENSLQKAGTQL